MITVTPPMPFAQWLRGERDGRDLFEEWFTGCLDDATLCEIANDFNMTRKQALRALHAEELRQQQEV